MQYYLIVTESSMTPRQVENGVIIERIDLPTTREETNLITVQQA